MTLFLHVLVQILNILLTFIAYYYLYLVIVFRHCHIYIYFFICVHRHLWIRRGWYI